MKVTVFPTKFNKGATTLTECMSLKQGMFLDIDEALSKRYTSDAHFVPYYLGKRDTKERVANSRINKKFGHPKFEVFVTGQCFDVDMPRHEPLEMKWAFSIIDQVFTKTKATLLYLTKNGIRFIQPYEEPITWWTHEKIMKRDLLKLIDSGIKCDWLFDYTRYFRLPNVQRDGKTQGSLILTRTTYEKEDTWQRS